MSSPEHRFNTCTKLLLFTSFLFCKTHYLIIPLYPLSPPLPPPPSLSLCLSANPLLEEWYGEHLMFDVVCSTERFKLLISERASIVRHDGVA